MSGTLTVIQPGLTACLACVYPQPPPFEESFPVVGAISCAIGSLAALEALKILSGDGKPMWGAMFTYDGYQGRMSKIRLTRKPHCVCCGDAPATQDRVPEGTAAK
jgi:adenylyltransferase/sulfurtransferase